MARQKPRCGYRRQGVLKARLGWPANPKRVSRLYRQEHLAVRRLKRKRVQRIAPPLAMLTTPNQEWAIDYVTDSLIDGRRFRALTMVDSFTRDCLAIEADSCLASQRVTRVFDRVIAERGKPTAMRCDNRPEFTSRHFLSWDEERQIRLTFIEAGRPMQNAHIKSSHGRFRGECLNAYWCLPVAYAKGKIESWRKESNSVRPHSSLGYLSPEEFAARLMPRGDSTGLMWGQGDSNAIPSPHTPIPAAREGSMTR